MDNRNTTSEFYEEFWKDSEYQQSYAQVVGIQDRIPAIKKVWGERSYPKKVLDYGCGNGVLTDLLKEEGFGEQIIGVDVSETGVAYATETFMKPGLTFETIGFVNSVDTNYFDAVVSSHVFEHIDNPAEVLKSIKDKGKEFIIEVPLERCLVPAIISLVRGKKRKDNRLGHVNFWNKKTFREFISQEGLQINNEYHYASAPYSPFNHWSKRYIERAALLLMGLRLYGKIMATHFIVSASTPGNSNDLLD